MLPGVDLFYKSGSCVVLVIWDYFRLVQYRAGLEDTFLFSNFSPLLSSLVSHITAKWSHIIGEDWEAFSQKQKPQSLQLWILLERLSNVDYADERRISLREEGLYAGDWELITC